MTTQGFIKVGNWWLNSNAITAVMDDGTYVTVYMSNMGTAFLFLDGEDAQTVRALLPLLRAEEALPMYHTAL